MPFQSPWARISLRARWGVSLLLAALAVAALIVFVHHNDSNGEVPVSAKNLRKENAISVITMHQDQAPVTVRIGSGTSARAALTAAVRADMRHRIATGNAVGPLQRVSCAPHGGTPAREGFHCIAEAASVGYPFLAVATPKSHRAVFCKRDYPPVASETIPVSKRCLT